MTSEDIQHKILSQPLQGRAERVAGYRQQSPSLLHSQAAPDTLLPNLKGP